MTFAGRVKCIYIDPPYNTGNKDFVYNDRFVDKEDLWRHSKWCEFMFQRLTLAKDLLTQDGVIFVSIDDNEIGSLRLLMERIFGVPNFIATCIWQKIDGPKNTATHFSDDHEYVVVFALKTAHAVHKLNKEDGGNRRVILVSSTEATIDEPDKNLCRDVCATRVRRVIEGYGDTAGLGGDFAYLTCRRIAPGKLMEIDHAQVWTALQLTHCESLSEYRDEAILQAGDEDQLLIYLPRFQRGQIGPLRAAIKESRAVIVYSWQPELVRQRLRNETHVQIEAVPESLARRFGMRV